MQGVGGERRAKEREESAGKIGCEWCGVRGRVGVPRAGGFLVYPRVRGGEVLQGERIQGGGFSRVTGWWCSAAGGAGLGGVRSGGERRVVGAVVRRFLGLPPGKGKRFCRECGAGERSGYRVGARGLPTCRLVDVLGSWRARVPRVAVALARGMQAVCAVLWEVSHRTM